MSAEESRKRCLSSLEFAWDSSSLIVPDLQRIVANGLTEISNDRDRAITIAAIGLVLTERMIRDLEKVRQKEGN